MCAYMMYACVYDDSKAKIKCVLGSLNSHAPYLKILQISDFQIGNVNATLEDTFCRMVAIISPFRP